MAIEVREPRTQQELDLYYDLRWRVLREQWTKSRDSGRDEHEHDAYYLTAWDGSKLVGTGRLHLNTPEEAQVRCMAVAEHVQGLGFGRRLMDACWESARELEVKSVFALTNAVGFFERCGYHRIDKSELPQRIWNECVRCPLFLSVYFNSRTSNHSGMAAHCSALIHLGIAAGRFQRTIWSCLPSRRTNSDVGSPALFFRVEPSRFFRCGRKSTFCAWWQRKQACTPRACSIARCTNEQNPLSPTSKSPAFRNGWSIQTLDCSWM